MVLACVACSKELTFPTEDEQPDNYAEMFKALKLEQEVTYNYVELINNSPTGNKGTIKFSLADTSMTETYNNYTIKDHFLLDSLQPYTCKFVNMGLKGYNVHKSVFINNAQQTLSYVNGATMVSFGMVENGSYYYYQYIIKK